MQIFYTHFKSQWPDRSFSIFNTTKRIKCTIFPCFKQISLGIKNSSWKIYTKKQQNNSFCEHRYDLLNFNWNFFGVSEGNKLIRWSIVYIILLKHAVLIISLIIKLEQNVIKIVGAIEFFLDLNINCDIFNHRSIFISNKTRKQRKYYRNSVLII